MTPSQEARNAAPEPERPRLVAYVHLRADAGRHTRSVLEGHVRSFAEREGYHLVDVVVGTEPKREPGLTGLPGSEAEADSTALLLRSVQDAAASAVLIVGPAVQALIALKQLPLIHVLTLAQSRPIPPVPNRARPFMRRPGTPRRGTNL